MVFDVYIREVAEFIQEMGAKGRRVRQFEATGSARRLKGGLPIRVGPQANSGIILREDTFTELGSPEAGSCAFSLGTDNLSLITDDRITLIGPDIQGCAGQSLPFGQVAIVGGPELDHGELTALGEIHFVGDRIEGYMVRSLSRNLWSRVSNDAVQKGFCFETLGRALMAISKSTNPKIQTMELVFVTSSREDLGPLYDIATQVEKINKEIVRENWRIKGYDLNCSLDCSSCADKKVCDDIREVLQLRKKKAGNEPDSQTMAGVI